MSPKHLERIASGLTSLLVEKAFIAKLCKWTKKATSRSVHFSFIKLKMISSLYSVQSQEFMFFVLFHVRHQKKVTFCNYLHK